MKWRSKTALGLIFVIAAFVTIDTVRLALVNSEIAELKSERESVEELYTNALYVNNEAAQMLFEVYALDNYLQESILVVAVVNAVA